MFLLSNRVASSQLSSQDPQFGTEVINIAFNSDCLPEHLRFHKRFHSAIAVVALGAFVHASMTAGMMAVIFRLLFGTGRKH